MVEIYNARAELSKRGLPVVPFTNSQSLAPASPGDQFDASFHAEDDYQQFLLERAGQLIPIEDSYIAATARRHDLTIVTGNDKDFRRPGLKVFNPFRELAYLES